MPHPLRGVPGPLSCSCGGTLGRSPRIPAKIPKKYRKRESMVLLFFMMVFADIFFEGWGNFSFVLSPPGSSLWIHLFHPVGELWLSFCILKHLWVSGLGNFPLQLLGSIGAFQSWENTLWCQTGLRNPHVGVWWNAMFLCLCPYTGNWLVMSACFSTRLLFYG